MLQEQTLIAQGAQGVDGCDGARQHARKEKPQSSEERHGSASGTWQRMSMFGLDLDGVLG